jgi:hypothetical protein
MIILITGRTALRQCGSSCYRESGRRYGSKMIFFIILREKLRFVKPILNPGGICGERRFIDKI